MDKFVNPHLGSLHWLGLRTMPAAVTGCLPRAGSRRAAPLAARLSAARWRLATAAPRPGRPVVYRALAPGSRRAVPWQPPRRALAAAVPPLRAPVAAGRQPRAAPLPRRSAPCCRRPAPARRSAGADGRSRVSAWV